MTRISFLQVASLVRMFTPRVQAKRRETESFLFFYVPSKSPPRFRRHTRVQCFRRSQLVHITLAETRTVRMLQRHNAVHLIFYIALVNWI